MKKVRVSRHTPVTRLVAEFGKENEALLEAMKLFEVSNAEYERAMRALAPAPVVTASSTQGYEEQQQDALVG